LAIWNTNLIPDQTGKVVIVTGATSGLGLCCAQTLAARGAGVIMAVRDVAKGSAVVNEIRAGHPGAALRVEHLDLGSLASIAAFASRMSDTTPRIDVLLNNAGLGMQPQRTLTVDGFEQQFGTNHLGHFALTAQLVPALLRADKPRVVTVSSIAHRRGAIHWDDPNLAAHYTGRTAYNQSKLANLMFALELAARAAAQSSRLESLAAHPGLALTGFLAATRMPRYKQQVGILASKLIGQSAEAGSWPLLYAAAMPDAHNGDYWAPDGLLEISGAPARGKSWPRALVAEDRARLWSVSETLTGVRFPGLI
jgi:NAD(P)-dependent dehydrogenase (short-subunit alcohol dehydrogenase family)